MFVGQGGIKFGLMCTSCKMVRKQQFAYQWTYSSMVGSRLPTYIRVSDKGLDLFEAFVVDANVDEDVDVGVDGFL